LSQSPGEIRQQLVNVYTQVHAEVTAIGTGAGAYSPARMFDDVFEENWPAI
jgi:hypothetical protein